MRALVAGAGPAGTVAALALQQAGWHPTIFEAREHSSALDQGVFLTLAVNGRDALAAVGADEAVRELGFPTGHIRFLSGTGKNLGTLPIGPRLPDGTVARSVLRADLYAALLQLALDRGIEVHHAKRLNAATRDDRGLTATFDDGATATGDVLVGADGLRSTVRALIDPDAPPPRYTGMGNVGALTRSATLDVAAEAADGDYRMIWGRRCFFGYTVAPDGEIWWFANPPSRTPLTRDERADPEALKRDLLELLDGDRGPAAEIVAATPAQALLVDNQHELGPLRTWQRDGMVVIGDAAHAVSPATGQGVSLACEDAVTLGLCLRDGPDPLRALAAFEGRRRDRVERIARWGARMGATKTTGPVGRVARDLMMPRFLALGASPRAQARQAWVHTHHLEWSPAPAGGGPAAAAQQRAPAADSRPTTAARRS